MNVSQVSLNRHGKIKPVGDSQKVCREMIAWTTVKYGHQEITYRYYLRPIDSLFSDSLQGASGAL